MSATPVTRAEVDSHRHGDPRVRHQARDAAVLMSFSLVMSVLFAAVLLLLAGLGR